MPRSPEDRPRGWIAALARLVLRVFFREIELVGEDSIPRDRPLLLVANHVNGLVDPALVLGVLPVEPRFLAKSTLWKIPLLANLLDAAGAIPVYRRQDVQGEAAAQQNEEMFARCHEALAEGGAIALFPEGASHSEPALLPLKTGAARIVLEAERRLGPLGVRIVPVGLIFEAKGKFRSRAFVRVGEPLDPAPELAAYIDKDGPEAVRALTARIDAALKAVTLNYGSWDDARLIARAADLFARPGLDVPRGRTLQESFALHRAFLEGYAEMRERQPGKVAAVADCLREYDRLLRAFGLRDDQVASAYEAPPVARFVGRTLLRLLLSLPVALVGTALNLVPFYLIRLIARRVRHAPDQLATYKVLPSLLVYPLAWALQAWAAVRWWGTWAGIAAFLLAPLTGYAAVLFHERRERFFREARAYLLLRTRGRVAAELRERRREVFRQVEELVGLYFTKA